MQPQAKPDQIKALVEAARRSYTIGGPNEHGEYWIEHTSGTKLIAHSRDEAAMKLEQHSGMKVLNDLVPCWREHDWHLYAHDAELMVRTIVNEDAEVGIYAKKVNRF